MRIQHNIMAMNAYRNYNTNTSALSKNLEKLSSGYKINRAGDDAAGLAISEKMRAQITGLNAAQKNVKDGISLVKTAEGAMQEIQDMLNRMDYLATQSANGTYDDDVDRKNLQKEVDQLLSEINRIADSANFNGIKLLDGSLDPTATGVGATAATNATVDTIVTSEKGDTLASDTILHQSGSEESIAKFGVALHELKFSNNEDETLEISVGSYKISIAGDGTGELGAKAIVDKIKAAGDGNKADVTFTGFETTGTADEVKIGDVTFKMTASDDDTTLLFTAKAAGDFNPDMAVSVKLGGTKQEAAEAGSLDATDLDTDCTTVESGGTDKTASYTYDLTGAKDLTAGNYEVQIAGETFNIKLADGEGANELATKVAAAFTALKKEDGITEAKPDDTPPVAASVYTATATNGVITISASGNGTDDGIAGDLSITGKELTEGGISGHYNKQTTQSVTGAEAGERVIASAVAVVDADSFADGTKFQIGDKQYTITTADADKTKTTANSDNKVYVGDLDLSTADGLKTAIDRLSVVATSNSVWTVGQGATTGTITFVEKVEGTNNKSYMESASEPAYDLTKEDEIKNSLGIVKAGKEADAGKAGKELVLQIGDTSDSYNQLQVKVGDMHAKALGIDGLKIDSSESAAAAIATIKAAINQVSGVRGDLGATQNRLEHTANNLSVMAENIQDAESTIRDTDVAEEMMAYTKNNILIQSAQAMLAQANAVPQGVLQLLG